MKEIINRSALIVCPKVPFKEWATLYNELSSEEFHQRLKEKHAYLIDWIYEEGIGDVLEPYYLKIFEYELSSWNVYKKEWPENRSYESFLEWFEISICDDLFDLETERIQSETV